MRGPSRSLWPVHYKPYPNELLSSWIVRLAHGNGLKVQTFCNLFCGKDFQVWVRDIDRLPPSWLVDVLSTRTHTSSEAIWKTTLRSYQGILFEKLRISGQLQWVLALQKYHRIQAGHALQYCPSCLAEDEVPFFRKQWRLAFYTQCLRHQKLLRDRCPKCDVPVALHRIDMQVRDFDMLSSTSLATCHECHSDLRLDAGLSLDPYDKHAFTLLKEACRTVGRSEYKSYAWDLGRFAVFHHICKMLTTDDPHTHLRAYAERELCLNPIGLPIGRITIETLSLGQRHHLMQLATWFLVKLESRLMDAWKAGAVRYNMLLKDFTYPPDWYIQIAAKLAHWRDRLE